jgi:hypothetical protein
MQVNTSKTKVLIFSSKRKHKQHKFYFEGNTLEEVEDYKYLGVDFNKNLSWEGCRKKRTLGGWKAFYAFQNRCREAELWDWKTMQTLFGILVIPVVIYGCEVWANSTSDLQWNQIEKIKKRLIANKFKIKSSVPYDISVNCRYISYLVEEFDLLVVYIAQQRIHTPSSRPNNPFS